MAFFKGKKSNVYIDDVSWETSWVFLPSIVASLQEHFLRKLSPLGWSWLRGDFETGFKMLRKYDEYSFRYYLRSIRWPHEVFECVEPMKSPINQDDLSFTELIMQNLDYDPKDWNAVEGGMSKIVVAGVKLIGHDKVHGNSAIQGITEKLGGTIELEIWD